MGTPKSTLVVSSTTVGALDLSDGRDLPRSRNITNSFLVENPAGTAKWISPNDAASVLQPFMESELDLSIDFAYYASATGDDSNDGLTALAPKTFTGALASFPPIYGRKAQLILVDDITIPAGIYQIPIAYGPLASPFEIIGGFTTLLSGTFSAATGVTATDSSQSMTIDEHRGHFLRVTSGSSNGNRRVVRRNTATQFTMCISLGTGLVGAAYVVEEPARALSMDNVQFVGSPGATLEFVGVHLVGTGATGCTFGPDLNARVSGSQIGLDLTTTLAGNSRIFCGTARGDYSGLITGTLVNAGCFIIGGQMTTGSQSLIEKVGGTATIDLYASVADTAFIIGDFAVNILRAVFTDMQFASITADGPLTSVFIQSSTGSLRAKLDQVQILISREAKLEISTIEWSNTIQPLQVTLGARARLIGVTGTGNDASGLGIIYIDDGSQAIIASNVTMTGTGDEILVGTTTSSLAALTAAGSVFDQPAFSVAISG